MIGRAMVLAAGLALLGAPQARAQDDDGDHAQMRQRAPRAEMHQRMHRAEMRRHGPAGALMFDRAIGRLMDRKNELNLTDDQMGALRDLQGEARSTLAPMRQRMKRVHEGLEDGSLDREDARSMMQGLHEQLSGSMEGLHGQLGEILDDEQRAALHQGRVQRARHGARRGRMQRQRGQMQRQHDQMQRQHKRMQEQKEAEEESASVDS